MNQSDDASPGMLNYAPAPPARKRASLLKLVVIAVVGSGVIEVLDHGPSIVRMVRGMMGR